MSDCVTLVLFLTYHFLEALQSCCTDVIQHWSVDNLKDVLCFGRNYHKAIGKLDESELDYLREHISSILPSFQQFSLDLLSSDLLTDGLSCLLQVLTVNPYLSKDQRDVIFEFCLDTGVEVPKFPPLADQTNALSTEVSLAVQCRCLIAHLRTKSSRQENVFLFLDSCFAIDPERLVHLVIGALEQLVHPIADTKQLERHLTDWLIVAIDKDQILRVKIALQNPQRLRDLILASPAFEECIIRLFDKKHLAKIDDPTPFVHLLRCLANRIPRWPELCGCLHHMAFLKTQHTDLWKELIVHTNVWDV